MGIPYFDAHCDTISCCEYDGRSLRKNDGQLDLLRLGAFERAVQVFAIYKNAEKVPDGDLFACARRQQSVFARELEENSDIAVQCRSAGEIEAASAAGRVAALLSCEGGELLNCDPDCLDWAASVGVKAINLTWNHANLLCGSNIKETERGLSDRGRAFVRRAQELGILMDVSHCSDAAFWDLIHMTQGPVIASHSNARTICSHPRNLTDDMFRALCETGGVAGINFYSRFLSNGDSAAVEDVIRHIEHFLSLGGENSIGLGGDWDGCDPLAGNWSGVQDLPMLWEALQRRGFDSALLNKLFFKNWLRVFSCQ